MSTRRVIAAASALVLLATAALRWTPDVDRATLEQK